MIHVMHKKRKDHEIDVVCRKYLRSDQTRVGSTFFYYFFQQYVLNALNETKRQDIFEYYSVSKSRVISRQTLHIAFLYMTQLIYRAVIPFLFT